MDITKHWSSQTYSQVSSPCSADLPPLLLIASCLLPVKMSSSPVFDNTLNAAETPYNAPPELAVSHSQPLYDSTAARSDSEHIYGYWIAPDGTKRFLTGRQAQQMTNQAPPQSQSLPARDFVDHNASPLPPHNFGQDGAFQPGQRDMPDHQPQLDPLDQEMLAEAHEQHNQPTQDEKHDEAMLDESLSGFQSLETGHKLEPACH